MNRILVSAALALAVSGPAWAQSASAANAAYLTAADQSDRYEVQAGRLAADKGQSAGVKSFGQMMVQDHTKSAQELVAAARKSGMAPPSPPAPDADQQAMLGRLAAASGPAFDREYLAQQLQAHQKALSLHSSYAGGGADPNLKAAAQAIAPVVKTHLERVQQLQGAQR